MNPQELAQAVCDAVVNDAARALLVHDILADEGRYLDLLADIPLDKESKPPAWYFPLTALATVAQA